MNTVYIVLRNNVVDEVFVTRKAAEDYAAALERESRRERIYATIVERVLR